MLILCNGMLRSGSTLQYNLAAEALEAAGPVHRVGFLGAVHEPRVERRLAAMRDSDGVHIVKTHEAPLPPAFYTATVRTLFSYRDLRDVAASIRKKWQKSFDEIVADLEGTLRIHRQIAERPGVLVQPYSLLHGDMPQALAQISHHLGVTPSPRDADAILARNALDSVVRHIEARKRNRVLALLGHFTARFDFDREKMLHNDHVSRTRGESGDWARLFTAEEIRTLEALQARQDALVEGGLGAGAQAPHPPLPEQPRCR